MGTPAGGHARAPRGPRREIAPVSSFLRKVDLRLNPVGQLPEEIRVLKPVLRVTMRTMMFRSSTLNPAADARRRSRAYGFTMLEMTLVVLIMSILSVAGMDAISTFEANQRA